MTHRICLIIIINCCINFGREVLGGQGQGRGAEGKGGGDSQSVIATRRTAYTEGRMLLDPNDPGGPP